MHLSLPVGQFGLVPGGHFGGDVVARPVAPLDEAEADQKGTETGGGGYPHGGVRVCKVIPVFQGGEVLPPPSPPPQQPPPPLATAAGSRQKKKKTGFKSKLWK